MLALLVGVFLVTTIVWFARVRGTGLVAVIGCMIFGAGAALIVDGILIVSGVNK
jgi:hypothetical protein